MAIPAIVIAGLLLVAVLTSIGGISNAAADIVNASDPEYENNAFNWPGALFCLVVIVLVAGLIGMGPLAGLVTTEW